LYDLRNIIAAIFLFGVVAADLIYSVVKGREFLFSWLGLLFAALAIIALFFDQIRKFSFSPKEGVVVEVQEAQVKASANLAAAIARDSGKPGSVEEAASVVAETITPETLRRAERAIVL